MAEGLIFPAVFLVAALLTAVLRRYALARQVIDVPNDRSAHTRPTPRGGGVAIVVSFLLTVLALAALGRLNTGLALALCGAGALVALIGFADDHKSIPAHWRLVGHFTAAVCALVWLGGMPAIDVAGMRISLGWFGHGLAAVYLVWLLNLYNFMDGIDGLSGVEAVTVGLSATTLSLAAGQGGAEWLLPALLAMAVAGFLVWNWPPAKIFMGDAGSGFLGMTFGVLSIRAAASDPALLWSWVILLGVFVTDTTLTIFRRSWRGEKLHEAHAYHAYQHAARRLESHRRITLAVGAINLAWLLPVGLLVARGTLNAAVGVVIAYLPLVWLGVRWQSGCPPPVPPSPAASRIA